MGNTIPTSAESTLEEPLETVWANQLADELGETGKPRKVLRKLARLIGLAALEEIVKETRAAVASGAPETLRADGSPRTPGGVLFRVAKGNVKRRLTQGRERGDLDPEERRRLHTALRAFGSGNGETKPT